MVTVNLQNTHWTRDLWLKRALVQSWRSGSGLFPEHDSASLQIKRCFETGARRLCTVRRSTNCFLLSLPRSGQNGPSYVPFSWKTRNCGPPWQKRSSAYFAQSWSRCEPVMKHHAKLCNNFITSDFYPRIMNSDHYINILRPNWALQVSQPDNVQWPRLLTQTERISLQEPLSSSIETSNCRVRLKNSLHF